MKKLDSTVSGISDLLIFYGKIVLKKKPTIRIIEDDKISDFKFNPSRIIRTLDYILSNDDDGNVIKIYKTTLDKYELFPFKGYILPYASVKNEALFIQFEDLNNTADVTLSLVQCETNKVNWQKKINLSIQGITNGEYIWGANWNKNGHSLVCLSRFDGELIWEKDLEVQKNEQPWQIGRIIGVFEQVLAVMIRWETMEQLVGLDVNTGQIRWHLNTTHDPQTGEVVFPNIVPCLGQMQASTDGRRLYGLRYNVFIEIEPATGNILRLRRFGPANSLHFTHQGKEISIKNTRLHEGHFYFTATLQGETFSSGLLGAFDIAGEQIVWLHDMGFTRGGQFFNEGAAPVLDGNRLYALDGEGTLHIFEKE